jgi:hypothetical protein
MNNMIQGMNKVKQFINMEELSTEKGLNILCAITPTVGNIFSDKEVMGMFSEENQDDSNTVANMANVISLILEKHRKDVYKILASLSDRTIEDVAKQNFFDTFEQVAEILNMEALKGFFTSSEE